MDNPTNQDLFNSIYKLIGIVNQLMKQVEDLQDIILEQNNQSRIQQEALENFLKKSQLIPLQSVFITKIKLHPDININAPQQKKNIVLWMPTIGDCNSEGAKN